MENNDNMMDELQNVSQPESLPEIAVVEAPAESESAEGGQDAAQPEEPEKDFWTKCWSGLKCFGGAVWGFVKARKRWAFIILLALVAVVAVLLVLQRNKEGKNRYESLGQTITEMKRISEFCTASYIGEVMVQDEGQQFLGRKYIVMIVRGTVRMGYDLSKMETEVVNDSVINLTLPTAQILDIITNSSDTRIFSEKGKWEPDQVANTKNAARAKLVELVMEENMLATAEENGKRQLTALFSSFGFKQVNITFVADSTGTNVNEIIGDSVSENATTLFAN